MELNLKFSTFVSLDEAIEAQKKISGKESGKENVKKVPGIYVLSPFKTPYYVGISTVRGKKYWIFERVIQHVKKLKSASCTYVIFDLPVYQTGYPGRNLMIPRLDKPTKPPINFFPFARKHVLFWRENSGLGFLPKASMINPGNPMGPVSNIKGPLRNQISHVVNTVFSSPNFSFFYLPIPQIIGLSQEKEILKCIEAIVKFSLRTNTISDSKKLSRLLGELKKCGISKINITCPNTNIKNLFYPFPHDQKHNPVTNLKGIVNII
ncbi:MAG: hypothetical protein ACQEW9_05910 [Bacteroidota bacterium]